MKPIEPPSKSKPAKELSRSIRFLRAILDSSPEGILVASECGEIVFANQQAADLWLYPPSILAGLPVHRLFDHHIALMDLGLDASSNAKPLRVEALRGDGRSIALEVKLRHLAFEGQNFRVLAVTPLSVRTEEEIVEEQLRVFESLEVFAGGMAHEFNNILTGVMGNLHLALESLSRRGGRMEPNLLEEAYGAALRAREVTRELFQLATGDQPVQGANALPQLISEAAGRALAGGRVQIETEFAPDLRAAFIDAHQSGQVLHQLLRFAAAQLGHAGRLRVTAKNFRVAPGDSGFGGELLPADYVVLTITIPGHASVPSDCTRLFEPYRAPGNALTGLSLAICRSLIRRQAGLLRAALNESEELQLQVYLPACRDVSSECMSLLRVDVPYAEGCHVLVMDDEELVRMVLKRSLEGMGHRVLAVPDGEDAVSAFEEAKAKGDPFDVVFLDLIVRCGTGGKETCRELLELDPEATCILVSGSLGDEAMVEPESHGFVDNLEKPFDLHKVSRVMNRVLERQGKGCRALDRVLEEPIALDSRLEPSKIVDFRLPPDRC